MIPVTIADQRPYPLTRLGHQGSYVLTPSNRHTPELRYRIPGRRPGEPRRWLKVVLRARVELDGDHGDQGFGAMSMLTDNRSSATAEFGPVRRAGGKKRVRWTGAALHGGREVVTSREQFRVAFSNYAREQGSGRGTHALAFRLRLDDGIRVRRVVVESGSSLILTQQPPQALEMSSATVRPPTPLVQRAFTVRFAVKNTGVVGSGPVSFDPLLPTGVTRQGSVPRISGIAPGQTRTADLTLVAGAVGAYRIETLASSKVGQALGIARLDVAAAPSDPEGRDALATIAPTSDGGLGPMPVALIVVAAAAVLGLGAWRVRRRS